MKTVGFYTNLGQDYIFEVITGSKTSGLSFSLFKVFVDDEQLNIASVFPKWKDLARKHLVGSAITHNNLSIKWLYGDSSLLNSFIDRLNKATFFKVAETAMGVSDFADLSESFMVFYCNPLYTTVRRASGVEYTEDKPDDLTLAIRKHAVKDIEALKKIYDLSWILNDDNTLKRDYRLILSQEDLDWVIQNVEKHDLFGYDTETTGLKICFLGGDRNKSDEMIGIGLSWAKGTGIYIPFASNRFETLSKDDVLPKLMPLLEKKDLMMANGAFDIRVTYHEGYYLENTYDVIEAEYLIDPVGSRNKKGVKESSRFYLNEETLELDEICGGTVDGRLMLDFDPLVLTIYTCSDVDYLFRIREKQEHLIAPMKEAFEHDLAMQPILAMADYYGTYVNTELLEDIKAILEKDLVTLEKVMWRYLNEKIRSNIVKTSLHKAYNEKGYPFDDKTFIKFTQEHPDDFYMLMNARGTIDFYLKQVRSKSYDKIMSKYDSISTDVEMSDLFEEGYSEYSESLPGGKNHNPAAYLSFTSNDDVGKIMYELLQYPDLTPKYVNKFRKPTSKQKTNDPILEKLYRGFKVKSGDKILKKDLMSCGVNKNLGIELPMTVILSKEKLETTQYPFAYMMTVHRKITKQITAFCDGILKNTTDGWFTPSYNSTFAATGRILCPVQTVQKFFKYCISNYPGMKGVNADAKQIELRVMAGLGNNVWKQYVDNIQDKELKDFLAEFDMSKVVERISLPWTDYHRESCCKMFDKAPGEITKEERSDGKIGNFTIPYDGGPAAIMRNKLAAVISSAEREKIILRGNEIKTSWQYANMPIHRYLTGMRDLAVTPVKDRSLLPPRLQPEYMGDYGIITNIYGRRRVFDLNYERKIQARFLEDNIDVEYNSTSWKNMFWKEKKSYIAGIRREAGNFPIQSTAADFYKISCRRLYDEAKKRGYIGRGPGKEKFIMTQFVHDEFSAMYAPEIHPFEIYDMIRNNCMLQIPGHPTYYWGVSMVDCWHDGKEDRNDAPIEFLDVAISTFNNYKEKLMAEDYSNPKGYVRKYMLKFMKAYAQNHIKPYIKDNVLYYDSFLKYNENYTLVGSICDYSHTVTSVIEGSKNDITLLYLSSPLWEKAVYKGKIISKNDFKFEVTLENFNAVETKSTDEDEFSFDFDDSFDGGFFEDMENAEIEGSMNESIGLNFTEINPFEFIDTEEEAEIIEKNKKVVMINMGGQYHVDISKLSKPRFNLLIKYLKGYISPMGSPIVFIYGNQEIRTDWKISDEFDDNLVTKIVEGGETA